VLRPKRTCAKKAPNNTKQEEGEMPMPSTRRELLEVSSEQQTASQLVKRIRKLRWMGMEDEAKRLQSALDRIEHEECVLAAPRDTD
jgi:hypothetical protein